MLMCQLGSLHHVLSNQWPLWEVFMYCLYKAYFMHFIPLLFATLIGAWLCYTKSPVVFTANLKEGFGLLFFLLLADFLKCIHFVWQDSCYILFKNHFDQHSQTWILIFFFINHFILVTFYPFSLIVFIYIRNQFFWFFFFFLFFF